MITPQQLAAHRQNQLNELVGSILQSYTYDLQSLPPSEKYTVSISSLGRYTESEIEWVNQQIEAELKKSGWNFRRLEHGIFAYCISPRGTDVEINN